MRKQGLAAYNFQREGVFAFGSQLSAGYPQCATERFGQAFRLLLLDPESA
jgi:hypothetical protein